MVNKNKYSVELPNTKIDHNQSFIDLLPIKYIGTVVLKHKLLSSGIITLEDTNKKSFGTVLNNIIINLSNLNTK